TTSTYSLKVT
ncbi:hypothetical protein JL09_g7058, partial [Pichia kudriavzevii]